MFQTTGLVNKNFINEIKRYLIPTYYKVALAVIPLLLLIMIFPLDSVELILTFPLGSVDLIMSAVLILCIMYAMLAVVYHMRVNKLVKLQLDRIFESTGTYEVKYTVSFEEDGVAVQNHATGAKSKMKYEIVRRLVKCESFYLLFTASRQFVPIFTECLSEEEKEELFAYLKRRIPALKC